MQTIDFVEKIIPYFLNLCHYYSVRMSICGKLQGASVVFLVSRERSRNQLERDLPISRLFRRLVNSLKVARSHSRVLSLCLYPIDPVVLTALPTVSFTLARPSAWQIFNLVPDNEFSRVFYTSRRNWEKFCSLNFVVYWEGCSFLFLILRKYTKLLIIVFY